MGRPLRPRKRVGWDEIAEEWGLVKIECMHCGEDDIELLERAHIIDHAWDGLDVPWNMLPLCIDCHANQKIQWLPGQETRALVWFGMHAHEHRRRGIRWLRREVTTSRQSLWAFKWAWGRISDDEFEWEFTDQAVEADIDRLLKTAGVAP